MQNLSTRLFFGGLGLTKTRTRVRQLGFDRVELSILDISARKEARPNHRGTAKSEGHQSMVHVPAACQFILCTSSEGLIPIL
jgi:hypothetical protein